MTAELVPSQSRRQESRSLISGERLFEACSCPARRSLSPQPSTMPKQRREFNVRLSELQAVAAVWLVLLSVPPTILAGQQPLPEPTVPVPATQPAVVSPTATPAPVRNDTTANPKLPQAPAPTVTGPLSLHDTAHDYTLPKGFFFHPLAPYTPTD